MLLRALVVGPMSGLRLYRLGTRIIMGSLERLFSAKLGQLENLPADCSRANAYSVTLFS